jgi:hypothetical protein
LGAIVSSHIHIGCWFKEIKVGGLAGRPFSLISSQQSQKGKSMANIIHHEIHKSFELSNYSIDDLHAMSVGEFADDPNAVRRLHRAYAEAQQAYLFALMQIRSEKRNHD